MGDVEEAGLPRDSLLDPLVLGDVVVDLQDRNGPALRVVLEDPATGHDDRPAAVEPGMHQLAFPVAVAVELGPDVVERLGKPSAAGSE